MNKKSRVVNDNKGHHYITCAECGEKAISFGLPLKIRNEIDEAFIAQVGEENYLYQGITGAQNIPSEYVDSIVNLLNENKIKKLNTYITSIPGFSEGIDAYCDHCESVYCKDHYVTYVIMADDYPGFYDCTMGICPKGHKRKIDD